MNKTWFQEPKGSQGDIAHVLWQHVRSLAQVRRHAVTQAVYLQWMYDREKVNGFGQLGIPESMRRYFRQNDLESTAGAFFGGHFVSDNIFKGLCDYIVTRFMDDMPSIEVAPYNGDYETSIQAALKTDALDGTLGAPRAMAGRKQWLTDGVVTGTGFCFPEVSGMQFALRRIQPYEVFWDPHDSLRGEPGSIHYWVPMDRDEVVAMAEECEVGRRTLDELKVMDRANMSGPWTGEDDRWLWVQKYLYAHTDSETEAWMRAVDNLHVLYSWRRAHGHAKGRHVITVHGGGYEAFTIYDEETDCPRLPIVWWSPWPLQSGGIEGVGPGHILQAFQRQVDRVYDKLDQDIYTFGQARVFTTDPDAKASQISPVAPTVVKLEMGATNKPIDGEHTLEVNWDRPQNVAELDWLMIIKRECLERLGINEDYAAGGSKLGANASGRARYEEQDRQTTRFADVGLSLDDGTIRLGECTLDCLDMASERDRKFRAHWKSGMRNFSEPWKDLAMPRESFNLQVELTGSFADTKAGRVQRVLEATQDGFAPLHLAQGGLQDADERAFREKMNAGYNLVVWQIAGLSRPGRKEDEYSRYMPTDFTPAEIAIDMGNRALQIAYVRGCTDETLGRLQEYVLSAKNRADQLAAKQAPPPQPGAPGMPGPATDLAFAPPPVNVEGDVIGALPPGGIGPLQ